MGSACEFVGKCGKMQWAQGVFHGKGTLVDREGERYEGQWEQGKEQDRKDQQHGECSQTTRAQAGPSIESDDHTERQRALREALRRCEEGEQQKEAYLLVPAHCNAAASSDVAVESAGGGTLGSIEGHALRVIHRHDYERRAHNLQALWRKCELFDEREVEEGK